MHQALLPFSSGQFSRSVMSDSLQPQGLHHTRFPCPSSSFSNSCPSSRRCHPTISSSVVPSPPALNLSQHQGLFKWVSSSHQVAKVLELQFSISPSNEYSGLTSFRIDWFPLINRNIMNLCTTGPSSCNSLSIYMLKCFLYRSFSSNPTLHHKYFGKYTLKTNKKTLVDL